MIKTAVEIIDRRLVSMNTKVIVVTNTGPGTGKTYRALLKAVELMSDSKSVIYVSRSLNDSERAYKLARYFTKVLDSLMISTHRKLRIVGAGFIDFVSESLFIEKLQDGCYNGLRDFVVIKDLD